MRKFGLTALLVASTFCGAALCGCSGNTDDGDTPPTASKPLPPYVISLGDRLEWSAVEYATEYSVYRNGQYVTDVKETYYSLGNVSEDCYYEVVAKNNLTQSNKSNKATVSKNCNYNENEVWDYALYNYGETIPANVRKVTNLSGFYYDFVIAERTTDLLFEFDNAQIRGCITTSDGEISRLTHKYNVIFDVKGDCSIFGKNGTEGRSFNTSEYDNACRDGYDGNDGQTCVAVPTLIVRGNGSLSLSGGNGGNGGNGSNATGLFGTAKPGKGSYGGDGGSALLTEYLVLSPENEDFVISLADGKGGAKGILGSVNGNLIGGVGSLVDSSYWYFTDGKDGKTAIGKSIVNNGKIILNGV